GGSANTTFTGQAAGDNFGRSIASADINGDGFADVIAGAPAYNTNQGRTYVFHSAGTTRIANVDLSSGGSANTTFTGQASGNQFGSSVALGDVNGDGFADVIVGALLYNTNQGKAYIFHSAGSAGIANNDLSAGDLANTTLTGGAANNQFGSAVVFGIQERNLQKHWTNFFLTRFFL
ncbi:MAG: FG-GAP repeat protein, partial [Leptospira sp.]|nr:FG-GAP repeat protein [Leptospira sp.]